MSRYRLSGYIFIALVALFFKAAQAHHSHAGINRHDVRVFKGVVVKYAWNMPHVFMKVKAPNSTGEIVLYSIEMQSPPAMAMLGWSKESFSPGDRLTWQGAHHRDKSRYYTDMQWAEKSDGSRFVMEEGEAQEAAQPSTDFSGLWDRDDPGGFKPHYQPPTGWPLTEKGQKLVDNFHEDQNPMIECGNPGPPKSMLIPYPLDIRRRNADTITMERELMADVRVIHLTNKPPKFQPSTIGHSIGRFEEEELIVETTDFVADRWGSHTGIDSSAQKHLLERFSLSKDGMYLHAKITLTDPVYLAEPVTFTHRWRKVPDRQVIQAPCTEESAKLYLQAE